MYVYRNSNTGDIYETPRRSLRLEALPNWLLISGPAEEKPKAAANGKAVPQRPLDSATREVWVQYAIARGMPAKDARALSKASLVKEFGREEED
ncbi:hypothetical protein B0I32_106246 [Nonomuraea fuscirosea]|uniref:Uncharacterized protein n=1 Tax=Nonomuraea fuscirosea TaxID=1291556 RepID=A0A2T0N294_9ACTN|nr:hypothetical protein [Nonomuraea fuscirosea]PRX66110.1 hypothetical protein B0I32_106246 [Nonomuraea fuscirosea]